MNETTSLYLNICNCRAEIVKRVNLPNGFTHKTVRIQNEEELVEEVMDSNDLAINISGIYPLEVPTHLIIGEVCDKCEGEGCDICNNTGFVPLTE